MIEMSRGSGTGDLHDSTMLSMGLMYVSMLREFAIADGGGGEEADIESTGASGVSEEDSSDSVVTMWASAGSQDCSDAVKAVAHEDSSTSLSAWKRSESLHGYGSGHVTHSTQLSMRYD